MYQFSSGSLYGIDSSSGVAVPRKFGALQDVSIDLSFTKKKLYGQNQYAIAIARGQGSITGKAKFASMNGAMLNALVFGNQIAYARSIMPIFGELGTVPGVAAYTVTVVNGANFADDLGVSYADGRGSLLRVVAAPTQGQYQVNVATGVYTFSAADANVGMSFDYTYTVNTTGLSITISQALSGTTPSFGMVLASKFQVPGQTMKPLYLNLGICTSDKLSMATKMDDFMVPEFDFEVMANVLGTVGTLALGE